MDEAWAGGVGGGVNVKLVAAVKRRFLRSRCVKKILFNLVTTWLRPSRTGSLFFGVVNIRNSHSLKTETLPGKYDVLSLRG